MPCMPSSSGPSEAPAATSPLSADFDTVCGGLDVLCDDALTSDLLLSECCLGNARKLA